MAGPIFSNNAVGTLAAAYTADATALTLTAGQGARFPSPLPDEWFPVTIVDPTNVIEIVHCTSRTGDTLTVLRGQEDTPPRPLGAGEKIEHRLTAGALEAIRDRPLDPSQIPDGSITGPKLAPDSVTSGKIKDANVGGPEVFPGSLDASKLAAGAAEGNLGFKPVQQGGGVGQANNKINIGWSVAAPLKLKLSVDGADKGNILTEIHDGTVNSAGYRGLVTNVANIDYTFGFVDSGRQLLHNAGNHTFSIPADAAVPLIIGSVIKVVNRGGVVTIVPPGGVSLVWLPSGASGPRTLAAPGTCVLEKMDGTTWWIYGMGLS